MELTECEPIDVTGLDKCATVYRKDPVSFVYVCYHCSGCFLNIERTLEHIESHFQLVQVTVEEIFLKSDRIDSKNPSIDTDNDSSTDASPGIKTDAMEVEEVCDSDSLEKSGHFHCQCCKLEFKTKFALQSHMLRDHNQEEALECDKCGKKFKRDSRFEKHLIQHIDKGEVDWECTGDGIRQPIPTTNNSSEQLANSSSSERSEQMETVKERRLPKKKNKTSQVRSRQKTRQLSTYMCHKCSHPCSTLNDLNDHLSTHSTDEILEINKCKECKRYFESTFELRLHVLDVHLFVKQFKCSACEVSFRKEEQSLLGQHLELHLADSSANWTNIVEGICIAGKDVANYEDIFTSNESSCELCAEKFYIKSNFDEHVRCMHSENEHELRCPQCDTIFGKLQYYFAHQLEHRRVGATVIETDMNLLVTNLNSYIEEQFVYDEKENQSNPYRCSICQTDRNSLFEIRRHVRERHVYKTLPQPIKPNLQEKFTCNICGMVIKRNSFRTHLMTHTDIKLHECSTCGKTFRNSFSKMTHERLHTGEKPFQCDQCGKRFFSNSLLGAHKKSHDSTTYPCKICGRVFNVPSGYRRHVQTHRQDKSYECNVCFKSFNTRVYLSRHMFKHSEKNYQCSFCDNKFNTANGLKQHEKSKHNYEAP
ncbi:zinc finger protein 658B-like [Bradysia coprophila]|uniref:zinc finger protein 658B-like n=1 Tax=Bradysia coprophila TaxID=38358 RepID=UPI00187DB265|nr:zinc finger protein 658B-like [Bradysia coprophila]